MHLRVCGHGAATLFQLDDYSTALENLGTFRRPSWSGASLCGKTTGAMETPLAFGRGVYPRAGQIGSLQGAERPGGARGLELPAGGKCRQVQGRPVSVAGVQNSSDTLHQCSWYSRLCFGCQEWRRTKASSPPDHDDACEAPTHAGHRSLTLSVKLSKITKSWTLYTLLGVCSWSDCLAARRVTNVLQLCVVPVLRHTVKAGPLVLFEAGHFCTFLCHSPPKEPLGA